ncbi:AB-hydrolase YheT [Nadsonia fulvescens var. elongata DSM 6958]|uniref:AB-hydrolase YheT n=1 Tax=Nadsonia fulvescens var. elongata DSM 6958 TaxID=857566 RepID=A0A1E3PS01_9ASCO|nr:AB-hydrolase YheT [Nadsonia fulvescens var. elongata DSM 6958]
MWSLRNFQKVTKSAETALLPLKAGDGKTISLASLIEEKVDSIKDGSYTIVAPTLGNGHLQTIYTSSPALENFDKIYYGRRIITWEEDGASVTCDFVVPPPANDEQWEKQFAYAPVSDLPPHPVRTRYLTPEELEGLHSDDNKPMVIALHGLSGGSHENYVRATLAALNSPEYGFECVVLNSRGCARSVITTPVLFNGAWTLDVRRFIKDLRKRYPNRPFYMVGYSLGASILANYLGQEGADTDITGACILANPWDLSQASYELNSTYMGQKVYSPIMASNLKKLVKNHLKVLEQRPDFDSSKLGQCKTILDFDTNFTATLFGFDTAMDYYRHGSSVNRLMNNHTPSLILHALDDPIAPKTSLPYTEVQKNPYTYMVTSSLGGHLGWFEKGGQRWFTKPIADFFKAMNDNVDHTKKSSTTIIRPKRLWKEDRFQVSI